MEKGKKYSATINRIRMLREGVGYSQEYVANKLNITQQAYSRIEKNPNATTLERLQQLSEILGVKVNSIVGEDDMYIQQNYHQQGGNASTVMYVTGLADREREALQQQIISLKKEIEVLTKIIEHKL
ncbi:MAG: helix-turn-helix domain-containing protein [Bacteroidota bacterium]